jgi:hypothetical protein
MPSSLADEAMRPAIRPAVIPARVSQGHQHTAINAGHIWKPQATVWPPRSTRASWDVVAATSAARRMIMTPMRPQSFCTGWEASGRTRRLPRAAYFLPPKTPPSFRAGVLGDGSFPGVASPPPGTIRRVPPA